MENEFTPEQTAMYNAYQVAKEKSLITSLTGAAGFKLGWEAAEAYHAAKQEEQQSTLHHDSQKLLSVCFEELRLKMIKNQEKYGYGNEWLTQDWENECREHMMQHIEKGDPRDVAIYALFMIFRGWSTKPEDVDTGDQCFTVDDVNKNMPHPYANDGTAVFHIVAWLNMVASAYSAKQNRELLAWKESAMKILSKVDDQEIGKMLGVPLVHSISENLLEKIKELKQDPINFLDWIRRCNMRNSLLPSETIYKMYKKQSNDSKTIKRKN